MKNFWLAMVLFGLAACGSSPSGQDTSSGLAADARDVCFYEHINFNGDEKCYDVGKVVDKLGNRNNTYSSVRVRNGAKVRVWTNANKQGRSATFTRNQSDLRRSGFHDNITSLQVRWDDNGGPNQCSRIASRGLCDSSRGCSWDSWWGQCRGDGRDGGGRGGRYGLEGRWEIRSGPGAGATMVLDYDNRGNCSRGDRLEAYTPFTIRWRNGGIQEGGMDVICRDESIDVYLVGGWLVRGELRSRTRMTWDYGSQGTLTWTKR